MSHQIKMEAKSINLILKHKSYLKLNIHYPILEFLSDVLLNNNLSMFLAVEMIKFY